MNFIKDYWNLLTMCGIFYQKYWWQCMAIGILMIILSYIGNKMLFQAINEELDYASKADLEIQKTKEMLTNYAKQEAELTSEHASQEKYAIFKQGER